MLRSALADPLPKGAANARTDYGTIAHWPEDYWIGAALRAGLVWEQEMFERHIAPLLVDAGVVVDVGAHVGCHTVMCAAAAPDGCEFYCFEPQHRMLQLLDVNLRASGIRDRASGYWAAVGDEAGSVRMQADARCPTNLGGAAVADADAGGGAGELVPMMRLDDMDLRDCSYLKVDVEGAEALVLAGAERLLARTHPPILYEDNWKRTGRATAWLARNGYTDCEDLLRRRHGYRRFERLPDSNVLAIHEDDRSARSGIRPS